jgi:coniferyl-aldehyde dehydrogenase
MNAPAFPPDVAIPVEFQSCFSVQRSAYLAAPERSYAERLDDLKTLSRLLTENRPAIVAAINADYGNRNEIETLFAEIFLVQAGIHDTLRRLKSWMKPRRRRVDLLAYPGARNRVIPQPLGVTGVIVPWNFPISLSFSPLVNIFAAGNRAMATGRKRSSISSMREIARSRSIPSPTTPRRGNSICRAPCPAASLSTRR